MKMWLWHGNDSDHAIGMVVDGDGDSRVRPIKKILVQESGT